MFKLSLEDLNPGMRDNMAAMGVSVFENVVASVVQIDQTDAETPAHWGITFGVGAPRRQGLSAPTTTLPWVHATTIEDPQGATFVASQFVPENPRPTPTETLSPGRTTAHQSRIRSCSPMPCARTALRCGPAPRPGGLAGDRSPSIRKSRDRTLVRVSEGRV